MRATGRPSASCSPATPRRAGRRSTSCSAPYRPKGGARHGCDDLPCASAWSRTRATEWQPSCRARTPIPRRSSPASTTPTSRRWPGGSTNLLRRPGRYDDGASTGIRVPLALTWRGAIVGILGPDPREWQRLQEAVAKVFGSGAPSWIAIATRVDGVTGLARSLAELQEGLRVADGIDRRGVIDDLSELGIERLLLSDPDLAAAIVERELGPLLADPRMGDELIETLQVFFDAGENRRETARRLHLADRTIAYRLERAEQLLGHGLEGEAGRRLNVALTLRRLVGLRRPD